MPVPASRGCPRCPPDNAFLEFQGTRGRVVQDRRYVDAAVPWFVRPGDPQVLFLHVFECVECGYRPELASLSNDPDDAVLSTDDLGIPVFGRVLGI